MTLGGPQPLSRRQARERARAEGEAVAAVQESIPTVDVPVLTPAALRPAFRAVPAGAASTRRSTPHHSSERAGEPAEPTASATPTEHALSRRELRALHEHQEQSHQTDAAPLPSGPVADVPVAADLVEAELVEAELVEAELVEPEPEPEPEPEHSGWAPPIGHWSIDSSEQRNAPAPEQSLDELINRGIGAGGMPTTTNALILPSIPHQGPHVSPISNTGEIIITGSFDLPRSLGSTGTHPNQFDSSEMDHMMDQLDADQLGGDSSPVSASHAVSTHASTRGMLTPPKKQRASLPMVMVITTAILAVSVLALFVTGYLLGIF